MITIESTIREAEAQSEKRKAGRQPRKILLPADAGRYTRLKHCLQAAHCEFLTRTQRLLDESSPAFALADCERIVDDLLWTDDLAFELKPAKAPQNGQRLVRKGLARWFNTIPTFERECSPHFVFSPAATAVFQTLMEPEFTSMRLQDPHSFCALAQRPQWEVCNRFLMSLRTKVQKKSFLRDRSVWRSNVKKDAKRLLTHLVRIVAHVRHVQVFALDLGYDPAYLDHDGLSLRRHLKIYLNNFRSLRIHADLAGYAWFHDFSFAKKHHIHLVLLFRGGGEELQTWLQAPREHWMRCTEGTGASYTCPYDDSYHLFGYPAEVHHGDCQPIGHLCSTVLYRLELSAHKQRKSIPNPQWSKGANLGPEAPFADEESDRRFLALRNFLQESHFL